MTLTPASGAPPTEPPDYRFFDLRGAHADVGYTLGQHDPPFYRQPWWAPPAGLTFTRECAAVVRSLHAPLMDEFAAYAEAQQWDADLLWQQCCRVNLKARFRLGAEGCSTVAWYVDGHALIGRNYDYWPLQARRQRIRFQPQPNASSYATLGARGGAPCGRYDGMNEHGLFVSLHVIMSDMPDAVQPGVPFHLVGRLALELCRTAQEAATLLTRMPHLSSLNYLVADPHEAFVIEADPRRVRALPMQSDVIAATNHFRHPDMRPLQGNRVLTHSACRLDKLTTSCNGNTETVDELLAHMRTLMADRTVPVCGVSGSLTTLWSCVAELNSRRIQYAAGAPCHTPYEEMPAP
jgi:predicted choloylglycine hydrolase